MGWEGKEKGENKCKWGNWGTAKRGDMNVNSKQAVRECAVWPERKERSRSITICKNGDKNG